MLCGQTTCELAYLGACDSLVRVWSLLTLVPNKEAAFWCHCVVVFAADRRLSHALHPSLAVLNANLPGLLLAAQLAPTTKSVLFSFFQTLILLFRKSSSAPLSGD